MTKQEEIREGILKRLNEFRWELQKPNALINLDTLTILQGAFADQILKDEDSQGAVIRVERELPKVGTSDNFGKTVAHLTQLDMLKWHEDSLEPLIEEL